MTIVNGIGRIGWMTGGKSALWKDEIMAQTLARQATSFIDRNKAKPFFMYLATHDIHVPRVPNQKFKGTTECGTRCDAIAQLDWTVGQVMASLEKNGLTKNTLVIFSSDNGPVIDDGYADGSVEALGPHKPAGKLRGGKYSIYEGGTRMPFLAQWPARIKPGVSDALICQVDLMASLGALGGQKLEGDAGPDSLNVLPALLNESKQGRETLVEHARGIALRKGQWKFVPPQVPPLGAPKQQKQKQAADPKKNAERNGSGAIELYNLADDLGETKNLAAQHPEMVQEMSAMLQKIRTSGRSR
jgi:arylsulfatase A-like enzyme